MFLDATLQIYWSHRYKLSQEKLAGFSHAKSVAKAWERYVCLDDAAYPSSDGCIGNAVALS
jgi:hypothetical protein